MTDRLISITLYLLFTLGLLKTGYFVILVVGGVETGYQY